MAAYSLGISCFYHDSAAALVRDGIVVAAAQEERFSRVKHDRRFPTNAIRAICAQAGIGLADVERVVFYESPAIKFDRLLSEALTGFPSNWGRFKKLLGAWVYDRAKASENLYAFLNVEAPGIDWKARVRFSRHHLSHAASAFFPSPFEKAAIVTIDGVGEWTTTGIYRGEGDSIEAVSETHYPHSLGLIYSAFTSYLGFKTNSGEYKVMGLAPYGVPRYTSVIKDNLIAIRDDGTFELNMDYFPFYDGERMFNEKFCQLLSAEPRAPETALNAFHADMAASIQAVVEDAVLALVRHARKATGHPNLCLAGGVALNCVANGLILREGIYDDLWVQPASGDAGGALGSAYLGARQMGVNVRQHLDDPDQMDGMAGAYLGTAFTDDEIRERLDNAGARYEEAPDEETLVGRVADFLAEDKVVGWFQGAMEYGPRALGNRSILGNPASAHMQTTLNMKIKFREGFRPFAPAVSIEHASEFFELDGPSPYMLIVAPVAEGKRRPFGEAVGDNPFERRNVVRSEIPAVTHVDLSARIQTVHPSTNPLFHRLIGAFGERTGNHVVINTSFNIRGEPIVCTPEDALRCFMGTDMDCLAVGRFILRKEDQNERLRRDYRNNYELD